MVDWPSFGLTVVLGVPALIFTGLQTWLLRRQMQATFEQRFNEAYDRIQSRLPLEALLLSTDREHPQTEAEVRAFFDYFELCDLQIHYRSVGRVSQATWADWWAGIRANLQAGRFDAAWVDINRRMYGGQSESALGDGAQRFDLLRQAMSHLHDPSYDPQTRSTREPIARGTEQMALR